MPDPGRPLAAAIAQRLDIGASRFAVGPSLGYDIPEPALERLLRSTLSGATERGLLVMIDMRTHMDRLTSKALARHAAALRRRSTFRLFVLDGDTMVENVCIRPWAYSGAAAWRARADSASVGRIVEGLAPGIGWPVRTDTTIDFPVDAVYTWVNGRDPAWREQFARFRDPATLDPDRFNHSDEFRYSMRSLDLFAPWIRRIHIVSNCPAPPWFEASDRVRWVDHGEFIPAEYLPLFSSRAIDTFIHRVPDLSEHFVYLNDDVLIWNDVFPGTFFTPDGKTVAHLAPHGAVIMWCQALDAGTATDWQAARVNGARLLLERYGVLPTRQHQHVPHALRRSVIETLEREFPDAFESARRSRFRAPSDILLIGLVYHNWAVLQGLATVRTANQLTIDGNSAAGVDPARLASIDFLCVNDVRGSALDERARRAKQKLFESRLPIRGSAERVVRDSPEATAG